MKDSELIKLIILLVVDAEEQPEEKLAMLRWLFDEEKSALAVEKFQEKNGVQNDEDL